MANSTGHGGVVTALGGLTLSGIDSQISSDNAGPLYGGSVIVSAPTVTVNDGGASELAVKAHESPCGDRL